MKGKDESPVINCICRRGTCPHLLCFPRNRRQATQPGFPFTHYVGLISPTEDPSLHRSLKDQMPGKNVRDFINICWLNELALIEGIGFPGVLVYEEMGKYYPPTPISRRGPEKWKRQWRSDPWREVQCVSLILTVKTEHLVPRKPLLAIEKCTELIF